MAGKWLWIMAVRRWRDPLKLLGFYICGAVINDAYYGRCVYKLRQIYGAIGQLIWNGRRIRAKNWSSQRLIPPRALKRRRRGNWIKHTKRIDLTSLPCYAGLNKLSHRFWLPLITWYTTKKIAKRYLNIQTWTIRMRLIHNSWNNSHNSLAPKLHEPFRLHNSFSLQKTLSNFLLSLLVWNLFDSFFESVHISSKKHQRQRRIDGKIF